MNKATVQLYPTHLLNDDWEFSGNIPSPHRAGCLMPFFGKTRDEEDRWINWIRNVRIEVAQASHTTRITSDDKYDYLLSEVGMNIIVPTGHIEEMRFQVSLEPQDEVVVIDGFPKDVIEEKAIVEGRVRVGLTKALKFIPSMHLVGAVLSELVEIELNPWEFSLGSLRHVDIDFSGSLTATPCWYLRRDGIRNDFKVAMTIRKPKNIKTVDGYVTAAWLYNPGFLKKARVGTDPNVIISIFK